MMRWTIRGIQTETADAVRDLAIEYGRTLREVVTLCIQHGLLETRRDFEIESAKGTKFNPSFRILLGFVEGIRKAFLF